MVVAVRDGTSERHVIESHACQDFNPSNINSVIPNHTAELFIAATRQHDVELFIAATRQHDVELLIAANRQHDVELFIAATRQHDVQKPEHRAVVKSELR
jgi:hypothetical protein